MRHEAGVDVAVQTLQKICENIINHPTEDKYRKLRVANAALQARLFDRSRGLACVQALGFQDGVEAVRRRAIPVSAAWEDCGSGS
ncbi:hypothetical protein PINS_up012579 [Pythium insidiosum]|nr:hypothetical protein PINS_up012579 [Pythium insidiosum]